MTESGVVFQRIQKYNGKSFDAETSLESALIHRIRFDIDV